MNDHEDITSNILSSIQSIHEEFQDPQSTTRRPFASTTTRRTTTRRTTRRPFYPGQPGNLQGEIIDVKYDDETDNGDRNRFSLTPWSKDRYNPNSRPNYDEGDRHWHSYQ